MCALMWHSVFHDNVLMLVYVSVINCDCVIAAFV
jgi:hypothetical protein